MKRRMFWIPLLALLVLATGLSAALFRGGDPSAVATPLAGAQAPSLMVPLLGTHSYLTSDTLRGKPHLLNFFASWCGPCAEENPVLMGLAKNHEIPIIGVAMKDDAEPLTRYLAKRGNPYDVVALDEAGSAAIDWGVTGVPETFAINAEGRVVGRYMGGLTDEDAQRMVQALLHPAK